MRSRRNILDFYASKNWAILESSLQEMFEIYKAALERKELGIQFDPEAVAARTGKRLDNTRTVETFGNGVAVVPVVGPMFRYANLFTELSGATSTEMFAKEFEAALADPKVRAVIIDFNTPGGEVDGTSETAQLVLRARDGDKPVIGYASGDAASAGYWLLSACMEIVCADTASLGSIGVVGSVRIAKDKSRLEFVSSRARNKRPDPETESGRGVIQSHIDALEDVFVQTVATNRSLSVESVVVSEGGLYVGQRAVDAGLADRVGTLEELIAELSSGMSKPKKRSDADAKNLNSKPVLQDAGHSNAGDNSMADKTTEKDDAKTEVIDDKTLTEKIAAGIKSFFGEKTSADAKPTADINAKADEDRAAIASAQAEAESAKKEAAEAKAQIAQLQKDARATRFESISKDWPGQQSEHVAMLELLATTQEGGEGSTAFKGYVTQQSAIAEQMRAGGLFRVVGSDRSDKQSAYEQLKAEAKDLIEASGGKLSEAQAMTEASKNNKELYKAYLAEQRAA